MVESKDIYLIGICGTGVGALAGLLAKQGHRVRGSDEHVYPPMSHKLAEWNIPVLAGYDAVHLRPPPDLVIVGNVIRRHNPEATYARENDLPTLSMPEAIAEFGIRDQHSIVVAGTHGKTTITALTAHILMQAGAEPGFLVGGALVDYPDSFRVGEGRFFVVEGDEYDTAYFDKRPKFLHYRPRTAIITSLEYDHADIFADITAVEQAFASLVEKVPATGHLVVWEGATRARRLIQERARAQDVSVYATRETSKSTLWLRHYASDPEGLRFEPIWRGRSLGEMRTRLWGEFSAQNVLAVTAALTGVGISGAALCEGFASFSGVRRRMEVRGEPGGITVVDDFAHHPTAVGATLGAARTRWPGRRLWAIFEPRSATNRRNTHHPQFLDAFGLADAVVIGSHQRLEEVAREERLDPEGLAADLDARGTPAWAIPSPSNILEHLGAETRRGDVVMLLSNGDFGGLHDALLAALARHAQESDCP